MIREQEFLEYLEKEIISVVKSYSKIVGKKKAMIAYEDIVKFCHKHNLSKNFVLLKLQDLLNESKKSNNE